MLQSMGSQRVRHDLGTERKYFIVCIQHSLFVHYSMVNTYNVSTIFSFLFFIQPGICLFKKSFITV